MTTNQTQLKSDDDPFFEETEDQAIASNIELIRAYHRANDGYASTSQLVMVGLALCKPELLAQANYPANDIKGAWRRLDDSQRQAVITWWRD